jgi:putative acetyltransferase
VSAEEKPLVELRRVQLGDSDVQRLIEALNAETALAYPNPADRHWRLDPEDISDGVGAMFVASIHGTAAGCGAVRRWGDDAAELKRMYVVPEFRGSGVADAIIAALEAEAGRLGVTRLLLETGELLPRAVGLYRRHGFVPVDRFGEYVDSPSSYCMGKTLA